MWTKQSLVILLFVCCQNTIAAEALTFSSGTHSAQLIELYTSQGCSSCPPADKWLSGFKSRDDLWQHWVPVAFHVDYWDSIGWKDPYAQPDFGQRQRRYQKEGAIASVYTPGFIVDGKEWRGWFGRHELPASSPKLGQLIATLNHKKLTVEFDHQESLQNLRLHVVLEGFNQSTAVASGENARKKLVEDFVVLWHQSLDLDNRPHLWSIELPAAKLSKSERYAIALWVTHSSSTKPIQVLGFWLPKALISRQINNS